MKKILGKRIREVVDFIVPILIVLICWEIVSRLEWVNPILLPPPTRIAMHTFTLLGPEKVGGVSFFLERHVLISFARIMIGYLVAATTCTILGLLMGINKRAFSFFNPLITLIMPIPSLAWVPVVILWLGLGNATIVFVTMIASIFPIIYNSAAGVQSMTIKHIWAAEIMGADRKTIFLKVLLPGAMPYIIAGHKLALGRAWRALVATEMVVATGYGLGYLIFEARTFMDTETMYGGIAMIALLGLVIEKGFFGRIERKTVQKWGMSRSL
ncbi:MAG: ABC transporter permease [Deltaproteobacteria bacterium]|nr:ABC transporter permease [Deltaproteobacteria bacterium]